MSVLDQTYEWLQVAYGEDHKPKSTEEILAKAELVRTLLNEELDEFVQAVKDRDPAEMINACSDLLVVACNLPFFAGFKDYQMRMSNKEVYESNMTKFCRSERDAIESKDLYAKGEHPNKPGVMLHVVIGETGHYKFPYKLERLPDRKLMKGNEFEDVDNDYMKHVALGGYEIPE